MHPDPPPLKGHLLEVCNFEQTDALITRILVPPVGAITAYGATPIGHQMGGGHVLPIMRVEPSGGICYRDDHSFLWPQKPGRARRLGIPKAICLHEVRIFSLYHSGAELAPFANGAPSCGRATLRRRFERPRFKAGLRFN